MFVWNADDLNREQEEAILAPGSIFLIACPGSGKTRALTYKIALELSRLDSARKRVIAITYTNRAADEIQERIELLGVDTAQLWIGTIHSFCLEWILRPYSVYHDRLKYGFGVISPHDSDAALDEICRAGGGQVGLYDRGHYFTSDGLVLSGPAHKHRLITDVLSRYHIWLGENRLLDFELILKCALDLILERPQVSKLLSSIFAFVLVDEYQDTKQIQYAILGAILRAGDGAARTFIVGDPNQAIYGTLGGYPIEPSAFATLAGLALEERQLSKNYRSSARIVEYFEHFKLHDNAIEAIGPNRDFASVVSFDFSMTKDGLLDEIARLIRRSVETDGVSKQEICVLAPQWAMLAAITRRLVAALPEYDFDGPGMVPFARDIENFWYKMSRIALTVATPTMYAKRLRWAGEVINDLRHAGVPVSELSSKTFLRASNEFSSAQVDGLQYLAEYFDAMLAWLGIDKADHPSLAEHHSAFFESSQARITKIAEQGAESIRDIASFRKVFGERTGVTVSTIHGVKGGEYDVVIAFGILQGMVPNFNDPEQVNSAKKLVYVTCSRARKHLYLIAESQRSRGRYGNYLPTEIVAALLFDYDELV
jgi:DNA helicase-2/ATP-dependent DNA helicase PcrA